MLTKAETTKLRHALLENRESAEGFAVSVGDALLAHPDLHDVRTWLDLWRTGEKKGYRQECQRAWHALWSEAQRLEKEVA